MKVLIDIDEETYKTICDKYATFPKEMKEWGLEAIKNGTPIPDNRTGEWLSMVTAECERLDNAIEQIRVEIEQIVDQETEHDKRWARGLHYALCVIDKHMKGEKG